MSKKKSRVKRGVVKGMAASIKYDRKSNKVLLTIRGRTHAQAQALYLFASVRHHPAVETSARLCCSKRPGDNKIIKTDYALELSVPPDFKGQTRLDEPGEYWLPPESEA